MSSDGLINRLLVSAVVALLLIGCGQSTSGGGNSSGDKKPVHLAFITNGTDPFWTIAKKGIDKLTSEDPNVTVDFREIATGTPAEQKQELDNELVKGVEGIAISVRVPAEQQDMINAAAKKAVVFTQDSDAPDTDRACYIGTNNIECGKQLGQEIKKALPNGGKVMVFVGDKDAGNARDRYAGIKQILDRTNVQVLDLRTDGGDREKAKANVSDTIVSIPDIACLVGLWSYEGPEILNAVKDAGKAGKIKIVCTDEAEETLTGIKDGWISATIVQQPFEFGYEACKMLAQDIRGDKSVVPANKQVYIPTKVINKDNLDPFWTELKKETGQS